MRRGLVASAVLLLVTVGGVVALMIGSQPYRDPCATGAGVNDAWASPEAETSVAGLDRRQSAVARAIFDEGKRLKVPDQGIVVALAVASQESGFKVYANDGAGSDLAADQVGIDRSLTLPHDAVGTDHGSLGVFQQQWPWWGSIEELMDPAASAAKFFAALVKVKGWETLPVTVAAQMVQRSAFPIAYADDEDVARLLVKKFAAGEAAGASVVTVADQTASASVACAAVAELCPPTGSPAEAGLTPDALLVLRCVDQQFGDHAYAGVGERASNSKSDHPAGRAVDVMIGEWEAQTGIAEGQAIAEWVRAHAVELGVRYVIWRARIWNVGDSGWRAYSHPSGATDATSLHMDHVHVSVYGNKGTGLASAGEVTWPVPASLKSSDRKNFGSSGEFWKLKHTGTDFSVPCGTPVLAAHAGTVQIDTGQGWAGRWLVKVTTGPASLTTWYAHMQSVQVRSGQVVVPGQQLGEVGDEGNSSGCHLHFEVHPRNGGIYEDGVNPSTWLAQNVGRVAGSPRGLGAGWRVASFNALGHSHTARGGYRSRWAEGPERTAAAVTMWTKYDLSVVGLQEFQPPQHEALARLAGDRWATFPGPGGIEPDNAIAWRADRFRKVKTARVEIPYFRGDIRSMPAVLLESRSTGRRYWVISVHNPANKFGPAGHWRAAAVRKEREFVATLRREAPVILTGDFNDRGLAFCQVTAGGLMNAAAGGSNGAGGCRPPARPPIDWIFGSGVPFTGYAVDNSGMGRVSDHQLVVATVG